MCLPRVIAGVIQTVPRQLGTVEERPFQSDWPGLRLKIAPLETGRLLRILILFSRVLGLCYAQLPWPVEVI
jgi:hypothetical protein